MSPHDPVAIRGALRRAAMFRGRRFLVPPGDVDALSGAMQALIGDPPLCQRMGTLAREEMQRRFAADIVVQQFEAFYARIASEWRKR